MFGPPGHLYVYFSYGIHWCANVVCSPKGECGAVLLRAVEPLAGIEAMYANRPVATRNRDLCSGPAKLTQAFSIDGTFDGLDLTRAERGVEIREVTEADARTAADVATSARIGLGVGKGEELPWRFFYRGNQNVSGRPR
jgi:DNA-3-methyladenine glycosylase